MDEGRNKLALTMIVRNEEPRIATCLASVRELVDAMIVVDTGSTDRTAEIARSMGATVYEFAWVDDFAAARNFALEQSAADWNLLLDADERVATFDREQLDECMANPDCIGLIQIISRFRQDGQDRTSHAFVSRLVPRGVRYEGIIHEQVASPLPRVRTSIEVLHDGYYETDKSERNLKLLELALQKRPGDPYLLYQLGKQYKVMKRYAEAQPHFAASYRLTGPHDAYRPELVMDYLYNSMALQEWERGLQLIANEEKRYADYPDFHFFQGLYYLELAFSNPAKYASLIARIEGSYLTCLKLGETQGYSSTTGAGSFLAAYNLAVFYETTGQKSKARIYYAQSADLGYEPARIRLATLQQ